MANWSEAEREKRKQARYDAILAERADLFKKFRKGGWEIHVVDPFTHERQPDNWPRSDCYYLVKMPGAMAARVTTVAHLLRMVKGVS